MADNQSVDLTCPACGKNMRNIFLQKSGISINICLDGCGGMLFDNRELNKFLNQQDNIDELLKIIENRNFKKVDNEDNRQCPVCKIPMVKMGSGVDHFQLDVCNKCGAKFVDNYELLKISESGTTDRATDELMNSLYKENLKNLIGENANKFRKSSPMRQLFEDIARRFI